MKKFIKTFIAQTLCVVQKFIKWIDTFFLRKSVEYEYTDKVNEARISRNRFFIATFALLIAVLLLSFLAKNSYNGFLRFGVICIENFAGLFFLYFLTFYLLFDSNVSEEKFREWLLFNWLDSKSDEGVRELKKQWRSENKWLCIGNYSKVAFWIIVLVATGTVTNLLIDVLIYIFAGILFLYICYRALYFKSEYTI